MNNYCVVICHKETHEEVKLLGILLSKEKSDEVKNKHNLKLNHAEYYIKVYESVTLNEFVEVCLCNGYKSMSVDFSNSSVSVLVGDKRVEATELGYEVII